VGHIQNTLALWEKTPCVEEGVSQSNLHRLVEYMHKFA